MRRPLTSIVLACLLPVSMLASQDKPAMPTTLPPRTALPAAIIENNLRFFEQNAAAPELGAFWSDIGADGTRLSEDIHLVALSRLIYALAYAGQTQPKRLEEARAAAAFLRQNMIVEDRFGPLFLPTWSKGSTATLPGRIHIWEEAYGFCGLAELYRVSGDKEVLADIRRLLPSFLRRYRDPSGPGFAVYFDTALGGPDTSEKAIQSVIYPISSFMANLWEADREHRADYEPILAAQLELALTRCWDETRGWIHPQFDREMNPRLTTAGEKAPTVMPGHNFQLAWTLLRTQDWTFLSTEKRETCRSLGLRILRRTLAKPIWDGGSLANGFFEEVDPATDKTTNTRKSWWQHCEALIALAHGGEEFRAPREELLNYFAHNFVDWERGSDHDVLVEGRPVQGNAKGSKGKSAYHTTEAMRYLIHYSR